MTLVDHNRLFAQLEKAGVEAVRKKLLAGSYGYWKVPLVKLWLERQAQKKAGADQGAGLRDKELKKVNKQYRQTNQLSSRHKKPVNSFAMRIHRWRGKSAKIFFP